MSSEFPTAKDLVDEAEFQLVCARENLQWLAALARAIASDAATSGRDTKVLVDLVCFLEDTGFSGIDQAIDQFKTKSAGHATQKAESENVSRTTAEVQA